MKRSKHNLSHKKLLSLDAGELVPLGLMEVLPGDSIQQATSALVRASPCLSPVMHPVHVRIHHFFVPNRLVWDDWEDFITGGPDGLDDSVFPTIAMPGSGGAAVGSLADYLGVPPGVDSLEVSALPFRAYDLIWNEYFRDQDLQTPLVIDTTSGPDTTTATALQNCCWEKDYFTSARPWEQKGPGVTIPLGGQAPVSGIGVEVGATAAAGANNVVVTDPNQAAGPFQFSWTNFAEVELQAPSAGNAGASRRPMIYADLTEATGVDINNLRQALALQRQMEARARFGSKYVDYLAYLGVTSSDARLQRPEYLGGGRQTIQFSEVLQTAEGTNPVGELRGHGIGSMRSNRYRRFFEEHGYVISLMSIRPKTIYADGIHRTWNRRTKEDYWQREFEFIGQQEILNKELYAAHATPNGTFGYQDRYDEYRRMESGIAGEFRTTTLNYWHQARLFASTPALNADFVKCVPTERTFAVPSEDVYYVYANHSVQARRLITASGDRSKTF